MRLQFIERLTHFNSIKQKLLVFMTVIGIFSVLAGVISSAYFSIQDTRESIQRKMETTTQIVGTMTESALLFEDAHGATQILDALQNEREIVLACLYRIDNTVLAKYVSKTAGPTAPSECPKTPEERTVSGYEHAFVFKHIILDVNKEKTGTITVLAHLETLNDLIHKQVWLTIIIVLVISVLALAASYVLQPLITGPILSLVELTKRISEEKDYSLRASTASGDEIGVLSSSFNHMLATIQEREKELYEINEKAESASRSKSEFLANMSHEIRTPINGILGFAQLLSVMELDDKQRSFVEIILSSGNTLLTVINDILDFSKIEAGKLHIESVPFDLLKIVEEVVDIMTARAEEKRLEIVMRFAPGTPNYVVGDPSRVRQILTNYVGNAIKFTEKGHIMINAEARILGNTETIIRFEVIDTGIGISQEAQRRIFDKFIQADASTTKKYGGTGLGLAISQQLAHLMGGEVGVTSEEGKGSTFWVEVPFRIDQNHTQISSRAPVNLAGCRMLVVDDHEVNRRILLELAENWNLRASAAESGEEALHIMKNAVLEGDPFHVAVLDYQLPNMDGEDLSNLIKTDRSLAHTSLILLTSMGMRGDANKFQEIGFEAYLVKPARAAVLLDTISTVWANRKQGDKNSEIITQHTFTESDRRGLANDSAARKQPGEPEASPLGPTLEDRMSKLMEEEPAKPSGIVRGGIFAPKTDPLPAAAEAPFMPAPAAFEPAPEPVPEYMPEPVAAHQSEAWPEAPPAPEPAHPSVFAPAEPYVPVPTMAEPTVAEMAAPPVADTWPAVTPAPVVPAAVETDLWPAIHDDVKPVPAASEASAPAEIARPSMAYQPPVHAPVHVPVVPMAAAEIPPAIPSPFMAEPAPITPEYIPYVAAVDTNPPPLMAAPVEVVAPAVPRNGYVAPAPGQERILLVEDQLTNRLVVENMLENIKLKTTHAENGQEAVKKVHGERFDLILMDVQMPIMNGYDATREIRKFEAETGRTRVPIVAVTANAMQGDREKCLEAGMDNYIAKPIQANELERMVRHYLAQGTE